MTPDNDNRPQWYDYEISARMPFMRKMANRMTTPDKADELIGDTYVLALSQWKKYNQEFKIGTWLVVLMRHARRDTQQKAGRKMRSARMVSIDDFDRGVPATQEDYVELSQTISAIQKGRGGDVLLRYAMGDELKEIGDETGLSRERVRQIKQAALSKLNAALVPLRDRVADNDNEAARERVEA